MLKKPRVWVGTWTLAGGKRKALLSVWESLKEVATSSAGHLKKAILKSEWKKKKKIWNKRVEIKTERNLSGFWEQVSKMFVRKNPDIKSWTFCLLTEIDSFIIKFSADLKGSLMHLDRYRGFKFHLWGLNLERRGEKAADEHYIQSLLTKAHLWNLLYFLAIAFNYNPV